ncbi:recombinase family protein [Paenibacillus sp. 32352]|uniref:recombinase family protein n=1 Tax=Paenibacillus sp. 32352 TaxID=1969111 RepID=UPI0009ABB402|nr:recombinase family protein [Paenibacillus sp. 32352]
MVTTTTINEITRAIAIYLRVSTEEQAQHGTSIDVQKERLIAYCQSQGWANYKLYIDDGYTGTKLERPAMQRLIRDIEKGKIHGVIVYKLDRLSRKQKDVLYLLEDVFEKNNVIFKSATEPFDTSTPFGKAMIGVLAVFAQLERDMIVERTVSGRREKVNQGFWPGGRVPFGYSWDKENKQLEIIPEEAQIVREIYKRYITGQSRLQIAEWAASRTKARVIDHSVIRDMLARPIYMGKLINEGELVDGNHEAIIDIETWKAAQREQEARAEGSTPLGEYLLTGLLECGVCNGNVVHVIRNTKPRGKLYSYNLYACKQQHVRKKDRNNHCSLGYFSRASVENFVISKIKSYSVDPKKFLEDVDNKNNTEDDSIISSLTIKLNSVNESLENLLDAIQSGVKASTLSDRINRLELEREALQNQLDDVLKNSYEGVSKPDNIANLLSEIGPAWDYLNEEEQKIVLRTMVRKVILKKDGNHQVVWDI